MARITIIAEDQCVYKDHISIEGLDLSSCNIPPNVTALQWDGNTGHIELNDLSNQDITELPEWANAAIDLFEAHYVDPELAVPSAESYYLEQEYWNDYPAAYLPDIQEFINQQHTGVKLAVAYKHNNPDKDPVGVFMIGVSTGASGLSGSIECVQKAEAMGLPLFSDITKKWQAGFEEFAEQQGWVIWRDPDNLYNSGYRPYTLDIAKARKKRIINRDRDSVINQGYNDGVNTWDIDPDSMTNMTAKSLHVSDTDEVVWRTKDNANVTMTGAQFKTIVADATNHIDQVYANSWTRKENVDAASYFTEVDAA
jgi:hypothetical protein